VISLFPHPGGPMIMQDRWWAIACSIAIEQSLGFK